MIRHSSSFLISVTTHLLLLFVIVLSWKKLPSFEEKKEIVCLKLCNVDVQKKNLENLQTMPEMKKVLQKQVKAVRAKENSVKKKQILSKPAIVATPQEAKKVQEIEQFVETAEQNTTQLREAVEKTQVVQAQHKEQNLEQEYLDAHIKQIVMLLQKNLYYPLSARKRGKIGEVVVKFKLSTQAQAHSIEVISSNSDILSRAAVKTIENISGEFPRPKEELSLEVPINYILHN